MAPVLVSDEVAGCLVVLDLAEGIHRSILPIQWVRVVIVQGAVPCDRDIVFDFDLVDGDDLAVATDMHSISDRNQPGILLLEDDHGFENAIASDADSSFPQGCCQDPEAGHEQA